MTAIQTIRFEKPQCARCGRKIDPASVNSKRALATVTGIYFDGFCCAQCNSRTGVLRAI